MDPLITEESAASILNVNVKTLRQYRLKNIGPKHVKLGDKLIRYNLNEIRKWIEGRTSND